MRLKVLPVAALLLVPPVGHSTVIDFSTLPSNIPINSYVQNGYAITTVAGSFFRTSGYGNPDPAIYSLNNGSLSISNGDLFTFSSVDLGDMQHPGMDSVSIRGLLGASTVFTINFYGYLRPQFFTLNNILADPAGGGPIDTLQIDVAGSGAALDNITLYPATDSLAVTPEPSAIAMLGTGMLGLFGVLRRRMG